MTCGCIKRRHVLVDEVGVGSDQPAIICEDSARRPPRRNPRTARRSTSRCRAASERRIAAAPRRNAAAACRASSNVRVPESFAVPRPSTLIFILRKSYSPGGVWFLVRHSTPVMAPASCGGELDRGAVGLERQGRDAAERGIDQSVRLRCALRGGRVGAELPERPSGQRRRRELHALAPRYPHRHPPTLIARCTACRRLRGLEATVERTDHRSTSVGILLHFRSI